MEVLQFIKEHKASISYFMEGGCFSFYLLLKQEYPHAQCYYDMDHIITKIDGMYYDVTGVVFGDGFLPLEEYSESTKRNIMREHYKPRV